MTHNFGEFTLLMYPVHINCMYRCVNRICLVEFQGCDTTRSFLLSLHVIRKVWPFYLGIWILYICIYHTWKKFINGGNQKNFLMIWIFPLIWVDFGNFTSFFCRFASFLARMPNFFQVPMIYLYIPMMYLICMSPSGVIHETINADGIR